jgi:hypothetical protein
MIDWRMFETAFGPLYAEVGRPGLPTRLMVGLHLPDRTRPEAASVMTTVAMASDAQRNLDDLPFAARLA